MTKKNSLIIKILIAMGIVFLVMLVIGWVKMFNTNSQEGSWLVLFGGIGLFLVFFFPLLYFLLKFIINLLSPGTIWHKILFASLTFGIFVTIIGGFIFFLGTPFDEQYNVDEVRVLDVRWNKLIIDYSNYNHGDDKTIEIKKPFFIKVNKEDYINVRYPINHPDKMFYVIDADVGMLIMFFGMALVNLWELQWFILIPYYLIRKIIKAKRSAC